MLHRLPNAIRLSGHSKILLRLKTLQFLTKVKNFGSVQKTKHSLLESFHEQLNQFEQD